MNTTAMIIAAAVALVGSTANPAFAAFESGVECNPIPGDTSKVGYNAHGVHNTSTAASAQVWCGGPTAALATVAPHVTLNVYDRHSGQDVCCEGFLLSSSNGAVIASSPVRCSGGFGTASQPIGLSFGAWTAGSVAVKCTMPPSTANGVSHVVNYRINN